MQLMKEVFYIKRLKTLSFQSTMLDLRLNNLMTLHMNKNLIRNTVHEANEFVEHSEYRKFVFGDAINV